MAGRDACVINLAMEASFKAFCAPGTDLAHGKTLGHHHGICGPAAAESCIAGAGIGASWADLLSMFGFGSRCSVIFAMVTGSFDLLNPGPAENFREPEPALPFHGSSLALYNLG